MGETRKRQRTGAVQNLAGDDTPGQRVWFAAGGLTGTGRTPRAVSFERVAEARQIRLVHGSWAGIASKPDDNTGMRRGEPLTEPIRLEPIRGRD